MNDPAASFGKLDPWRLNRANHEWEAYWQRAEKQAAGTGQPIVASL